MSFFFKNKKPGSGLPPASRKLTSADGSTTSYNSLRDGGVTSSPASVNTNTSVMRRIQSPTPEPQNGQPEQNMQMSRPGISGPPRGPTDMSLYPWSQQRLDFMNSQSHPFPRYGAAINSVASRDGDIYMMGGLINGVAVRGDLWIVEAGSPGLRCYPVQTTAEGPGARVGHASLLVGNAFIVFGGDTKVNENDPLDDTLYLLNTSTKHWSRALPPGPRPPGRYGHTLNILGSKIFVFGGQVEGYFFNDLVAFDLNALQQANSRWEVLIQNTNDGGPPTGQIPPARTNHSIVTYNERLYLFGGTDGLRWFNDVWTYDPKTNSWTQLDCIGFIPTPREGHAAALVGDVMYVFGGRTDEGKDLGDLAAFRINTKRWYTFQNMGPAPSPRSGHGMTAVGDKIVVLGGEPSSVPREPSELSLVYLLDTSKIRYPNDQSVQRSTPGNRRPSNEQRSQTPDRSNSRNGDSGVNGSRLYKPGSQESLSSNLESPQKGGVIVNGYPTEGPSPKITRSGATTPTITNPHLPPLRTGGVSSNAERATSPRATTPQLERIRSPVLGSPTERGSPAPSYASRDPSSPNNNSLSADQLARSRNPATNNDFSSITQQENKSPIDNPNRIMSQRNQRQRPSVDSIFDSNVSGPPDMLSKSPNGNRVQGGAPAVNGVNGNVLKELEALRVRNTWYASELALARKAGYRPIQADNSSPDDTVLDQFGNDEKPFVEALLRMRGEISRIQETLTTQTSSAAERLAQVQKERDTAIAEAIYNRTRLAGSGPKEGAGFVDGAQNGSFDGTKSEDINRRLASALATCNELSSRMKTVTVELEAERKARQLAEESAEAAYKRANQLDTQRQENTTDLERLRGDLHTLQNVARDAGANATEAQATNQLLKVDKEELARKLTTAQDAVRNHSSIMTSLRDAITASTERATLLERKLDHEKRQRTLINEKLVQLRAEHETRVAELDNTTARLRDAEELADSHANEAKKHREAVLAGLGQRSETELGELSANDERVNILQQRLDAANAMVKRNQDAADRATERLRRAEERIAGLEVYQEQTSREGLNFRKQLQTAAREAVGLRSESAGFQQQLATEKLNATALQVQFSALRNLLTERGVDASALSTSSSSIAGTSFADSERLRQLEHQLETSIKTHDQMRSSFEQREQEANKGWEEKIAALDNDYQSAVKYLKGTERMLSKMKQELARFKTENQQLEEQLSMERTRSGTTGNAPPSWEDERNAMRAEIDKLQSRVQESVAQVNQQMQDLQNANQEREKAQEISSRYQQDLERQRGDLENTKSANNTLEARATEAERKVQMLLDTVGTTVSNYRRLSQQPLSNGNFQHSRGVSVNSLGGDSVYSVHEGLPGINTEVPPLSRVPEGATEGRNSMALDSLANELETLRTQWENTKGTYRMGDGNEFGASRSQLDGTSPEAREAEAADVGPRDGTFLNWKQRLGQTDGGQMRIVAPAEQHDSTAQEQS